jgi:hypothetical protein
LGKDGFAREASISAATEIYVFRVDAEELSCPGLQ